MIELKQGVIGKYRFENGYGASVVCHEGTYGYEDGLYELAVLHDSELCYNTEITDNVVGQLSQRDLVNTLERIVALAPRRDCDHFARFLSNSNNLSAHDQAEMTAKLRKLFGPDASQAAERPEP